MPGFPTTDPLSSGQIFVGDGQLAAWGVGLQQGRLDISVWSTTQPLDWSTKGTIAAGDYSGVTAAEQELTHALGRYSAVDNSATALDNSVLDFSDTRRPACGYSDHAGIVFLCRWRVTDLWIRRHVRYDGLDDGANQDDFDAYLPAGMMAPITARDVQELGAIGFNVGASAPTPPPPTTTPTPPAPPTTPPPSTEPTSPPTPTPPTSTQEPPPVTTPPPVQVPPTPAPPMAFIVKDTTTGTEIELAGTAYSGPVSYLKEQYVSPTQDSVNVNTTVPDAFIVTGNGNDGIDTSKGGGQNVIDAEGGSNFITGGAGNNTIFLDDRNLGADIWTTITDFHAGDAVTLYGLTPSQIYSWWNGLGASGYQGLTMVMQQKGEPNASLTLTGYTTADLTNGRLSLVYGGAGTTESLSVFGRTINTLAFLRRCIIRHIPADE